LDHYKKLYEQLKAKLIVDESLGNIIGGNIHERDQLKNELEIKKRESNFFKEKLNI